MSVPVTVKVAPFLALVGAAGFDSVAFGFPVEALMTVVNTSASEPPSEAPVPSKPVLSARLT